MNLSLPQGHDDILLSPVPRWHCHNQSPAAGRSASGLYFIPRVQFQPSCTEGSLGRLQKSLSGLGSGVKAAADARGREVKANGVRPFMPHRRAPDFDILSTLLREDSWL